VARHGIRHLLLASRRGPDAPGATALRTQLAALGATVTLAACDTANEDEVRRLLAAVPARHPLTAVVHAAGVVDDGVLTALTPERMDTVLRPKIDTAWHLHRLTEDLGLVAFVLFSSAVGTLGAAGQANYAAGNAFLDALAHHRRASGITGVSLAWGLWSDSGMASRLQEADLARMAHSGVTGLSEQEGLALFDAAIATDEPLLIAAKLDLSAMRRDDDQAPLLRGLEHGPVRRRAAGAGIDAGTQTWSRLAALSGDERDRALLDMVCATAGVVLGRDRQSPIDPDQGFLDLGFDSLTALGFRNKLDAITGLRLPATLIFDYPSPVALVAWLRSQVVGGESAAQTSLAALEATLRSAIPTDQERAAIAARLRTLAAAWSEERQPVAGPEQDLGAVSVEELFGILDGELETQ
jgi:hypothetical protein